MRSVGDREDNSKEDGGEESNGSHSSSNQSGAEHEVVRDQITNMQMIRYMAEEMQVSPKQVAGFFDLLIETATSQTRKLGEFTIPGMGKLVKAQRAARPSGATRPPAKRSRSRRRRR